MQFLRIIGFFFTLLLSSVVLADDKIVIQAVKDISSSTNLQAIGAPAIKAKHFRLVNIDVNAIRAQLANNNLSQTNTWIELPLPDNTMRLYRVKENETMAPGLAKKFPQLRTYDGTNGAEWVKFEVTHKGFHAMIMRPGQSPIFIDPYSKDDPDNYMVYKQSDFVTQKKMNCEVKNSNFTNHDVANVAKSHVSTPYNSPCLHRTYRLAMAATYQYTQFAGGTVLDALSSQVTTVNRINGLYESEVAITLQLIENNDLMICTYPGCFSPSVPPYYPGVVPYVSKSTGGTTEPLALANQINTDIIIGTSNYDIGHLLDYNGGYDTADGLAWTPSTCDAADKAKGVTSGAQPLSDVFDIDFLAHELGHQFSATHTQNNDGCYREETLPTSVEPGSGSTIMSYAGICAPNVQSTSGPYFHGVSLQQIGNYSQGAGNCSVNTSNAAAAPTITGSNANATVPVNTPFALNVTATSNAGSTLTYNWEQMDPAFTPQPPVDTSTSGPNFRSFDSSADPTRYFPNLTDAHASAASGLWPTWEVIPSVARGMNYRVTVRNKVSGPSCNAYQDYLVTEVNEAGGNSFRVEQPTAPGIFWRMGTLELVAWRVANTGSGSIQAETVDILLSTDGGATYPHTLASGVPNAGTANVTVPNLPTTTGRVMVTASGRTFFNVSAYDIALANPQINKLARNPLKRTTAFLYYSGIPEQWLKNAQFYINIGAGDSKTMTVTADPSRNRLIVSNIKDPRAFNAKVRINGANGVSVFTNSFKIPGAMLG